MATLTNAQIEQKKQQLKQLADKAQQLKNELVALDRERGRLLSRHNAIQRRWPTGCSARNTTGLAKNDWQNCTSRKRTTR